MDTTSYFDFASLAALKGREALKQPENSKPVLEALKVLELRGRYNLMQG